MLDAGGGGGGGIRLSGVKEPMRERWPWAHPSRGGLTYPGPAPGDCEDVPAARDGRAALFKRGDQPPLRAMRSAPCLGN